MTNTRGRVIHVEKMIFEDEPPIHDVYVCFMGDFAFVTPGNDSEPGNEKPSMYNIRTIRKLVNVEDLKSIEAREKSRAWIINGL